GASGWSGLAGRRHQGPPGGRAWDAGHRTPPGPEGPSFIPRPPEHGPSGSWRDVHRPALLRAGAGGGGHGQCGWGVTVIQSVHRAALILKALGSSRRLGVTELGERVGPAKA